LPILEFAAAVIMRFKETKAWLNSIPNVGRAKVLLLLGLPFLFVSGLALAAQGDPRPFVNHIIIDGTINPAVAQFVSESIQKSAEGGAQALVIQLDTPGGLLSSTRDIVKNILTAPLPVIVYVAPSGAGAASAGMFVTISAHVAVMAPGTNIGAAHPVAVGGEEVTGVMGEKLENFVASYGEAIAGHRGRNVEWAIKAVRESAAIGASEALRLNVVDLVADNLQELLEKATGRTVQIDGKTTTLALAGAEVHSLEMRLSQKFINFIADPNIAYFLLVVGILGLYLEFSNPGSIFPGVAGTICLLLGAAAFQVLPINYTGLALIIFGVILLIAEVFVASFGILGISGIVSFVLGSFILFDSPGEALAVDRSIVLTVAATLAAVILLLGYLVVKSQRRKPALGKLGLVGETGEVIARIAPVGKIRVHGEIWTAKSDETIEVGEKAVIHGAENLHVFVRHTQHNSNIVSDMPFEANRRRTEIAVGLITLMGILYGFYVAIGWIKSEVPYASGYVVYADFASASGLNLGDPVQIAGVEVGTVKSITLADY
jgi:membrane-bound serine protease (ClpP class)